MAELPAGTNVHIISFTILRHSEGWWLRLVLRDPATNVAFTASESLLTLDAVFERIRELSYPEDRPN